MKPVGPCIYPSIISYVRLKDIQIYSNKKTHIYYLTKSYDLQKYPFLLPLLGTFISFQQWAAQHQNKRT